MADNNITPGTKIAVAYSVFSYSPTTQDIIDQASKIVTVDKTWKNGVVACSDDVKFTVGRSGALHGYGAPSLRGAVISDDRYPEVEAKVNAKRQAMKEEAERIDRQREEMRNQEAARIVLDMERTWESCKDTVMVTDLVTPIADSVKLVTFQVERHQRRLSFSVQVIEHLETKRDWRTGKEYDQMNLEISGFVRTEGAQLDSTNSTTRSIRNVDIAGYLPELVYWLAG